MWSNKAEEKLKLFSKREERKFILLTIELRKMLTDVLRIMVNNLFKKKKKKLYRKKNKKKKAINVLIVFSISYRSCIKIFLK